MEKNSFIARDYQTDISNKGAKILNTLNILILSMQVRTGKTITSLLTCEKAGAKSVLFITKKKVIESNTIQNDYKIVNPSFTLDLINYESVHKINKPFDIVIVDESHSLGAFPKTSLRTKNIKKLVGKSRLILLSGTITPESYSQIYHQLWISDYSPFNESNFYGWSKNYVNVKKRYVAHGNQVNDYSDANEKKIREVISKYMITFTQEEAGFKSNTKEHILYVDMKPMTKRIIDELEKNDIVTSKDGKVILGDTPVKKLQKVHQLCSGTVKLEDGTGIIIDDSKAEYIYSYFSSYKIGIFYKYVEEYNTLKKVFGDRLTSNIHEFNTTDKNIALQIVSGREGISLKKADALVMYNIDYSATSYWQSIARMQTKDRDHNNIFWVFSMDGIEKEIYDTVMGKKNYTVKHYDRSKVSSAVN